MKYGAQLFSLRKQAQDREAIRNVFCRSREMGYQIVQVSGLGPIEPEELRELSQEFALPIGITHTAPALLTEDLDKVISDHRIFGCEVVGLGSMPKSMRDGSFETFRRFFETYNEIHLRLRDAGMRFAYHNHGFEFEPLDNGVTMYDYLIEESEWDMIADVCWMHYAGQNVPEVLSRLTGRLKNAHLKDMRLPLEEKVFCPLGEGVVDLPQAIAALEKAGCENAYVEQDNATELADPFGEMERSCRYLKERHYLK